jgi:two-component system, NarL family, response regulator NreC
MANLHLMSAHAELQESSAPWPIRVLLAEPHAWVGRGLRLLLDAEQDIEMIAEAEDLDAALRHIHTERPHVLVLAMGMLAGSARETIGKVRGRLPDTQVVLLSMDESALATQRALSCGALGFVLKDRADDELAPAVRAAAREQEYVSPGIAGSLDSLCRSRAG